MKSRFKKTSSSINIIKDNYFETIFEYEGNSWKVIIKKNNSNNNVLFELSKVNSFFIFQNKFKESYNEFKNLLMQSIKNKQYHITTKEKEIEFNCNNKKYFLFKKDFNEIDNQSLIDELLIVKTEQKLCWDTIKKIEKENINLKVDIDLLRKELKKIKEENEYLKKNEKTTKSNKVNYDIKATYHIKDNDKNKDIKIIDIQKFEKDCEKDCEIYLNNQQINTPYKFIEEGEYTITFNFKKELEDISYLFYNCLQLIEIDLSNFKTQNVKSMKCLFSTCRQLKKINLKNINTNKVIDMKDMFSNCNDLEELDLSSFQTQNVETMENMFNDCTSLKKINVKNFDIRNVTTMKKMFSHCENLTDLDLSNFENVKVQDISFMFSNCKNLTDLDFTNFEKKNTKTTSVFLGINKKINASLHESLKNKLKKSLNK